jgi:hypothetical protein
LNDEVFSIFFEIIEKQFFREINMVAEQKLMGPASYFLSIEKNTDNPLNTGSILFKNEKI